MWAWTKLESRSFTPLQLYLDYQDCTYNNITGIPKVNQHSMCAKLFIWNKVFFAKTKYILCLNASWSLYLTRYYVGSYHHNLFTVKSFYIWFLFLKVYNMQEKLIIIEQKADCMNWINYSSASPLVGKKFVPLGHILVTVSKN